MTQVVSNNPSVLGPYREMAITNCVNKKFADPAVAELKNSAGIDHRREAIRAAGGIELERAMLADPLGLGV